MSTDEIEIVDDDNDENYEDEDEEEGKKHFCHVCSKKVNVTTDPIKCAECDGEFVEELEESNDFEEEGDEFDEDEDETDEQGNE